MAQGTSRVSLVALRIYRVPAHPAALRGIQKTVVYLQPGMKTDVERLLSLYLKLLVHGKVVQFAVGG